MKLKNLENVLLKEMDRQRMPRNIIAFVMDKLATDQMKNEFLDFMIDNRNIHLTDHDVLVMVRKIANIK